MRRRTFIAVLVVLSCTVNLLGCRNSQGEEREGAEVIRQEQVSEIKTVVEQWMKEVWGNQHMDVVDEIVSPEFKLTDPLGTDVRGPEGVKGWISGWLASFPDWKIEVRQLVEDGDLVGIYMWVAGTFEKDYTDAELNIPANKLWRPRGTIDIWRVVDGKIVEAWMSYDTYIFMQNIGSLPLDLGPKLNPIVETSFDTLEPDPSRRTGIQLDQDKNKETRAVVDRLESFLNPKKISNLLELFSKDCAVHSVAQPQAKDGEGKIGVKQWLEPLMTAMPDLTYTFEKKLIEGNMAVIRWNMEGTFTGQYKGANGNGKKIQDVGNTLIRVSNGKIAEVWHTSGRLGLLQQMDVLPSQQQGN